MVYANCLTEQHKFEQAKKEYIELLDKCMEIDNKDFICMTYRNLSELYFNKKDYKSAIKYIKYSLKYNPSNEYLNENLYFAAKIFQNLNEDAKEVEEHLLLALEICEKNDKENVELIEKILYELVLIYIKREDEYNMTLMSRKAKELNKDCYLIYLKLIEYNIDRNKEKSMNLIKESFNKIRKIKKI